MYVRWAKKEESDAGLYVEGRIVSKKETPRCPTILKADMPAYWFLKELFGEG